MGLHQIGIFAAMLVRVTCWEIAMAENQREQTPKVYKALQLGGALLLIVGVVVRVGGEFAGTGLALVGVLLYAVGRIAAWWKLG